MLRNLLRVVPLCLASALAAQNLACSVTESASGCAALDVTLTPIGGGGNMDLVLTGSGLHPNSLGAMVWGMTPTNVPLPFGGCPMLTDFVWGTHFQTDAAGMQVWSRTWPHWFHGYFYMQLASVSEVTPGNWEVRSTSCKLTQCQ